LTHEQYEEMRALCACLHLRRAARAVTSHYDAMLQPHGIKATQLAILVTLKNLGPAPMSTLANELVLDASSLSRNVTWLIREGLVRQGRGKDGRVRPVMVTPKGERTILRAYPAWSNAQKAIEGSFSDREFNAALTFLRRATDAALKLEELDG